MSKKIIFLGTPDYATEIFKKLLKSDYDVVALFSQPDKKVGRKQTITPPHIKQYCLDNDIDIPIIQPLNLKDNETYEQIKSLDLDFIVVAAYGQILPQRILDIAPCINLHASLLPRYRGASPIYESILNSDTFSGVTAMLMDKGLDSGDVLALSYLRLDDDEMIDVLFDKLAKVASDLIIKVLNNFDDILPLKQIVCNSSHCAKISKNDGLIELKDALKVWSVYRAFKFWPTIFLNNGLKLKEIKLHNTTSTNTASEILDILNDCIVVGCNIGAIRIFEVQEPSKKTIKAIDYIKGKRLKIGDLLCD